MRRRKLFVSVSGTIRAIEAGSVTEEDLSTGLFFLVGTGERCIATREEFAAEPAKRLDEAMAKAVADGRGMWTLAGDLTDISNYSEYRLLNGLLTANGYQQISEDPYKERFPYSQPAVAARVRDLEVITFRWSSDAQ